MRIFRIYSLRNLQIYNTALLTLVTRLYIIPSRAYSPYNWKFVPLTTFTYLALLIGKDSDSGKDWRQMEKGVAEDEMADSITDSTDMNLSKLRQVGKDREA